MPQGKKYGYGKFKGASAGVTKSRYDSKFSKHGAGQVVKGPLSSWKKAPVTKSVPQRPFKAWSERRPLARSGAWGQKRRWRPSMIVSESREERDE